mmetsp:Transcript_29404/g.33012  ORF Transcript_29404/g.33012 Transcript_29404/m.33012 type:complete len:223 (-) Transcript_29404:346-1014(-)
MGCQSSKPSTSAFVHPGNRRQANKPYAPPASAFSNGQATSHFVSYGGGNALVLKQGNGAAQPQIGATAATMTAGGTGKYKQPEYIQVTLPAGVTSGQTIQVAAPDGRLNEIIIPQGFGPGDTFTVEFSDAGTQPPPPPITANQAVPLPPPPPPRNNDYDDGFASGFGNNSNNINYAQATSNYSTGGGGAYYPTATDAQAVNTNNYSSSQQQQPSTMNYATPY